MIISFIITYNSEKVLYVKNYYKINEMGYSISLKFGKINILGFKEGFKMRALIYTRVSTQEQANEGISLDNQLEKIKAYCFARSWQVIDVIIDDGYSGKNLNRPGMQKIISMAKVKGFDVVVTYKLDRLTRSVKDLGYLIEDVFNKQDIAFTSVTDNFDTSTANGKLILNILGSVAQWERDIIAERTKDVLNFKKDNKKVYNHCPLGFLVDNEGNLIEDTKEQKTITYINQLRKDGLSLSKIANRLNNENIPTKKGGNWYKSTIKNILENSIYQTGTSRNERVLLPA